MVGELLHENPESQMMHDGEHDRALLCVDDLKKHYPVARGARAALRSAERKYVKAVDGVGFSIMSGDILGLAGESGSGKSTLGELLVRLQKPTAGRVLVDGTDIAKLKGPALKRFRANMQMIFQDPYATLNPRFTVERTLMEPLTIHKVDDMRGRVERARVALEMAELRPADKYLPAYPHQLSGGQRQRVAIARAIILQPKFIVADEPVSMLDVSVRSGVLNLLADIRHQLGLTLLFISHDLSTIRYLCNKTAVLYLGRIVEIGRTDRVLGDPIHPYTKALLAAVPIPDPSVARTRLDIPGEIPDPIDLPPGCRFWPRCREQMQICREQEPDLRVVEDGRMTACHRV